jgi:hypothetical protein
MEDNKMDNNFNQLNSKIASLETKNDLLEAELSYLNERLMRCGFPEGIKTLKETVEELLAEDPLSSERSELI